MARGLIAVPRINSRVRTRRARQKTRRLPHRVFITVICPSGIISGQRGPEGLNSGWLLARKVSLILHCRSHIHLSLPVLRAVVPIARVAKFQLVKCSRHVGQIVGGKSRYVVAVTRSHGEQRGVTDNRRTDKIMNKQQRVARGSRARLSAI